MSSPSPDRAGGTKDSWLSKVGSFFSSLTGIIASIATAATAITGLIIALNSDPSDSKSKSDRVDCSMATHPSSGTELRTALLDALREHYGYDGLYVVEKMTVAAGWAYSQAHPQEGETSGVERAYLLRHNGIEWVWQWEGDINPSPRQMGFPSGLTQSIAETLFRC